jgi:membrane associated rhomboid family serine protease
MIQSTDNSKTIRTTGLPVYEGGSLYGLLAISLLLYLLPDQFKWQLYLHLDNGADFRYWQVFSAHFMHISWQHLIGNGICIVILQQVYGHCFKHFTWLYALVSLSVFISLGLILTSVELSWYAGLSGIVIGLACYAALIDEHHTVIFNTVVLFALIAYSGFFFLQGEVSDGLGLIPVASFSHILGIVCGAFIGGVVGRKKRGNARSSMDDKGP